MRLSRELCRTFCDTRFSDFQYSTLISILLIRDAPLAVGTLERSDLDSMAADGIWPMIGWPIRIKKLISPSVQHSFRGGTTVSRRYHRASTLPLPTTSSLVSL